jgi:gas vesicle protein
MWWLIGGVVVGAVVGFFVFALLFTPRWRP